MRSATLILNPQAGRAALFDSVRSQLYSTLNAHGITPNLQATTADPDSARTLATSATQTGDLVIACGGDGTVHNVLQGLAGTSSPLGVLPFGTANALARNLHLPTDPVAALRRLLTFTPKRIPLGLAETKTSKSYFTVMAGAGPDGTLVQETNAAAKLSAGRNAYYVTAIRLFLTRRFPKFQVRYRPLNSPAWTEQPAVAIMASRIPDLGGLFKGLTSSSHLDHPHLLLQLLRAPAHISFPSWLAYSRAGLNKHNPWLATIEAEEVICSPLHETKHIYAQVDAEAAGPLPLKLSIVPQALSLLMPEL